MAESVNEKTAKEGLDLDLIEPFLTTYVVGQVEKFLFDEIDSTSTHASQLAAEGAPEGVLVIARRQTAGRGRLGRAWVSPPDAGIYMSIIIRPQLSRNDLPLLSLMTGVACAEAIERVCGLKIGLKWVNDLVYDGRKLGGILVEMASGVQNQSFNKSLVPPAVVIGIGLNLKFDEKEIPEDLRNRMTWLGKLLGKRADANLLVAEICNCIEARYTDLRHGLNEAILDLWKARSVTLGREIRAEQGQQLVRGRAIGIGSNGSLVVQQADGTQVVLYGGEVSVRLDDGSYA